MEESAVEQVAFAEALAEEAAEVAAASVDLWEQAMRRRMALAAPLMEAEVAEREAVRAAARRSLVDIADSEPKAFAAWHRGLVFGAATIDLTLSSGDEGGVCPLVPAVGGSIG